MVVIMMMKMERSAGSKSTEGQGKKSPKEWSEKLTWIDLVWLERCARLSLRAVLAQTNRKACALCILPLQTRGLFLFNDDIERQLLLGHINGGIA